LADRLDPSCDVWQHKHHTCATPFLEPEDSINHATLAATPHPHPERRPQPSLQPAFGLDSSSIQRATFPFLACSTGAGRDKLEPPGAITRIDGPPLSRADSEALKNGGLAVVPVIQTSCAAAIEGKDRRRRELLAPCFQCFQDIATQRLS